MTNEKKYDNCGFDKKGVHFSGEKYDFAGYDVSRRDKRGVPKPKVLLNMDDEGDRKKFGQGLAHQVRRALETPKWAELVALEVYINFANNLKTSKTIMIKGLHNYEGYPEFYPIMRLESFLAFLEEIEGADLAKKRIRCVPATVRMI